MTTMLSIVLGTLIVGWAVQAVLVALQVHKFSRVFLQPRRAAFDAYQPFAAVIVPFKGADEDLAGNVRSLCRQTYPGYRLLFVVDSADDPAYALLQREAARYPDCRIDLLIAGTTAPTQSQKIHNQLYAMEHLTAEDAVWVFADSDAAPGPGWLGDMVGPLGQDITGMTTGYRWLIPVAGKAGRPTWASRFASAINSSVACAYRRDNLSQAWGGSMAIRADTAEAGDLRSYLRGALTDDYQFTRMCRSLGRRVYFVPRAMAPTPVDFTWSAFFNFAYRQYLITRIYAPRLFAAALGITSLFVIGSVAAWGAVIAALLRGRFDTLAIVAAGAIVTVLLAHQVRIRFRARVIERAFGQEMLDKLQPVLRLERWGTFACMAVHWLIVLRSAFGRTMTWRTIRYRIDGPQQVRRLNHGEVGSEADRSVDAV